MKMTLSETEIAENWEKLLNIIKTELSGDKRDKLLALHEYFENRMALTPAAGKEHFHNAFPGGYVHHILGVIDCAKKLQKVWQEVGTVVNYTNEELVFSAICHDLGKVGDLTRDYYIPNESEWHRKNQGAIYNLNPELNYMSVTDRTFVLLSHFQVPYTENEFLSIRLADGLYNEHNKSYLMSYDANFALKTNLPFIIHAADFLAMHSEYDSWKTSNSNKPAVETQNTKIKKKTLSDIASDALASGKKSIDLSDFDKLFKTGE